MGAIYWRPGTLVAASSLLCTVTRVVALSSGAGGFRPRAATPRGLNSVITFARGWTGRHADARSSARRVVRCMCTDGGGPEARTTPGGADSPPRRKVVFLGTPDVAARSLHLLVEASRAGAGGHFDVVSVVTQPPAPSGRKKKLTPSPVQVLAEAEGIPVLAPHKARDEEFLEGLEALRPDLCVTAAYGQFLPRRFLDIPTYGTLNVHPSLLPKYRGASPVQRCLEAGEASTGVSVVFTVLKMDAGPIVRQEVTSLQGDEKAPELLLHLFEVGTRQLIDCLPSVWDSSVRPREQDGDLACAANKITSAEAECDFCTMDARTIHNKARAFAGWPGTWAYFRWGQDDSPRKIKLVTTAVGGGGGGGDGGGLGGDAAGREEVRLVEGALEVTCFDGSVLRVLEVQPPGKKAMAAQAFANGLRGATLWRASAGAATVEAAQ